MVSYLVSVDSREDGIQVGEALTKDRKSRAGCLKFFARVEVIVALLCGGDG